MNIIMLLFIISGVVLSRHFKKSKMFIANSLYILAFSIILFIFPFVSNNRFLSDIIMLVVADDDYDFISVTLSNVDYIFMYIFVITAITLFQLLITIRIIQKKIRNNNVKHINNYEYKQEKQIFDFGNKQVDKKLSLDKVFIDYCRMMN